MSEELLNEETIRSLNEMGTLIGNERYFASIFKTFQESFVSDMDALEKHINDGNTDYVRLISHRMKSSAKTIGAEALGERFCEIEAGIVQGHLGLVELRSHIKELRKLYNETMELFERYQN